MPPGCSSSRPRGRSNPRRPAWERWISDLPGGDWEAGRLPAAILSVAGRALRSAEGRDGRARARSRAAS